MSEVPDTLRQYLRYITGGWRTDSRTDAELLRAFTRESDEKAFVVLVWRHGPLVWKTCQAVLVDECDAEDAFQATFMAFARQARQIQPETLPNWLGRVARRISLNARKAAVRRDRCNERLRQQVTSQTESNTADAIDDSHAVVREELRQLPERLRVVLILYYFHGHTQVQIGEMLGITERAVRKRLTVGMAKLKSKLQHRGVVVTGLTLAGLLHPGPISANFPDGLAARTADAALAYASGKAAEVSATVQALAARATAPRVPLLLLIVGAVLVSVGVGTALAFWPVTRAPQNDVAEIPTEKPTPDAVDQPREKPKTSPDENPLAVIPGRVLDDAGRPVPHARVSVLANVHRFGEVGQRDQVLREVVADADGRFQLPVPCFRTADVTELRQIKLLAVAPDGRLIGTNAVRLSPNVNPDAVELRIQRTRSIIGRVVAENGRPVSDAVVRIREVAGLQLNPVVGEKEGQPGWLPHSVGTDRDGRYEIHNVPAGKVVELEVEHRDHAYQLIQVPDGQTAPEIRLGAARRLTGRVVDEDGKPIPSAIVVVLAMAISGEAGAQPGRSSGNDAASLIGSELKVERIRRNVRADADGRFDFSAPAGGADVTIWVHPPRAETNILAVGRTLTWPANVSVQQLGDVRLPRGIAVRGRVVDANAKVPISNARVQFSPSKPIPSQSEWLTLSGGSASVASDESGAFVLTVPRVPGRLRVTGPNLEYLVDSNDVVYGAVGSICRFPVQYHASVLFEIDAADTTSPTIPLRKGQPLHGFAELPDGSPVSSGWAVCRHLVSDRVGFRPIPVPIRDGQFSIPGCRPGYAYSVLIMTNDGRHGAYARLTCSEAAEQPEIVSLQPCGQVVGQFQNTAGNPVIGASVSLAVALEEEGPNDAPLSGKPALFPYRLVFGKDPPSHALTGKDGRVGFGKLIPGAKHLLGPSNASLTSSPSSFAVFVARAGKTLVLPPIVAASGAKEPPAKP